MDFPPRVKLVQVDPVILSAYPGGTLRAAAQPLVRRLSGWAPPDTAEALLQLHRAVLAAGGDFRVTDCFRSYETQVALRARYDEWLTAGKPRPGSLGWTATMKADAVSMPGRSNHNAGRAVDIATSCLSFPVAPALQLDRLWELAVPLGWTPIIGAPTENVSECWHFDHFGPWKATKLRRGYAEAAMAAALDIGLKVYGHNAERCIQAQLHRAGYDVGAIDGIIGARTKAGLVACGVGATCTDPEALYGLPDGVAVW
jgi:hypothetical protein